MKTSSWFDAFALLVISVMSTAVGVATDGGRVALNQPPDVTGPVIAGGLEDADDWGETG